MTKAEVEQIVAEAITKALTPAQTETTPAPAAAETQPVEKQEQPTAAPEITEEAIEKMVTAAIEKALTPKEEPVTMESVESMITKAVNDALAPVLKMKGLPTNIDSAKQPVEKQADEPHYLTGIL